MATSSTRRDLLSGKAQYNFPVNNLSTLGQWEMIKSGDGWGGSRQFSRGFESEQKVRSAHSKLVSGCRIKRNWRQLVELMKIKRSKLHLVQNTLAGAFRLASEMSVSGLWMAHDWGWFKRNSLSKEWIMRVFLDTFVFSGALIKLK